MRKAMKADIIGLVTTLLALYAFWVSYQAWNAHAGLGDSHGPFLLVTGMALVFAIGMAGLSLWLFSAGGAANAPSRASDEDSYFDQPLPRTALDRRVVS